MERETLEIITLRTFIVCAVLSLIILAIPGNETIGMYLMGGTATATLLAMLILTRNTNTKKKGE